MKQKFTFLIAALMLLVFMTPSMAGWGQSRVIKTYKLTIDNIVFNTTSYPANNNEKISLAVNTSDNTDTYEVKWTSYQVMKGTGSNSAYMQWQRKAGKIYNTTNLGTITSVTVTSSAGTFTTYYGTSSQPSSGAQGSGKGYFQTSVGNATGYSTRVEVVFQIEEAGPTQLATPANFSATAGNGQATFSWTAVEHANNYTILAKNGDTWDNPTTLFDNVSLTNGQFVGTGLTNGTTYVCKVRANGDGTNYSNSALSESTATFTPTAAQQYTVSIANGIIGGTVVASPATATEGTEISLTKTPSAGYGFTSWNVYKTGDQNTTVTVSNDKFNMPAYNVTVNATFTPYTVTLNANGTASTWNVTQNNGNLPAATAPCAAWSFYGWSETLVNSEITTAPSIVSTAYIPTTNNITLYAVYTKTEGGVAFNGTDSTGDFLIYATVNNTNYYAKGTGTKISSTTTPSEATTYTFEQPEGYKSGEFAIKTGSNYITYSSSTDLGTLTNPYKWTITEGIKGTWRVTSGTSGRAFIFRAGSTNKFGGYSTGNVTANGTEYYDLEIGTLSTTYYHSTPDCTETVATPTFDPDEGNYETTQTVHISCDTEDVSIFYTLNGNDPTNEASDTNFEYDAQQGVSIATTTTLKAKAYKTDWYPSAVASATYTIQHDVAEPTLPESQVFTTDTYSVTITVPQNTTVYYTTDGSTPTNGSTQYSTAFTIDATKTVKAIAYDGDGCASDVVSATYTRAYSLADAKALYAANNNQDVTDVTINLFGVQFVAKSGNYTYVQQGEEGLLIYGAHDNNWNNGDVFTAGTVTGTIAKSGQNLRIQDFNFANATTQAGTLAASAISVKITDITGDFSTYESRYVALIDLEMSVDGKTLTDDDSHTLTIYDPFNVLNDAVQPDNNVVIKGVVTSYTSNNNTTYEILPLYKADITTGVQAALPTLNPSGGATAGEATVTATVQITPATNTTVDYVFGEASATGLTELTEVTVPSTTATALELTVKRDFYTTNTATYYYKTSTPTHNVKFFVNCTEDESLAKEVVEGLVIGTLPTPTETFGFIFRGWTQESITNIQVNAPTMVTEETTMGNTDMNLNAVFATEGDPAVSYNMVSEISNGIYLIAVNKVNDAHYNFANGNASNGNVSVESTGVATASSYLASAIPEGAIEYILFGNNSEGFSIHCSSGYLNATSAKTSLSYGNSANETWIFSSKADGLVLTGAIYGSKVSCNSNNVTSAIRNYASGGAHYDPLYFFKKIETTTYSNYCTTVSQAPISFETAEYTIPTGTAYTLTTPVTVPSGKTLTVPADAVFANANPANLVIEDGGRLIVYTEGVQATVEKKVKKTNDWGTQTQYTSDQWYFIASPVNGAAFPTGSINDQDIYKLDWANNKWLNLQHSDNSSLLEAGFQRGTGYLYASKEGNIISVAGVIQPLSNDNTATVTLANDGWNLIGNPLTCKVTVDCAFSELVNASAVTNKEANSVINPCQGIAVYGNAGTEVTFTKAATQDAVAPSNNNSLQMTLAKTITSRGDVSTKVVDNAVVSFKESKGMPKFNMIGSNTKLFIPQDDEEYSIVFSDRQGDVPLYFKANETGTYTISFAGDEMSLNGIYLIDILAEEEIDLSVNPSYTFIGSPADRMARFKIVFRNTGGDGTSDIFAYQSGNDIIVSGEGELQIFDVMGRMVSRQRVNGVETVNAMPYGVYIFKLNGMTQKIVVR